MRWSDFRKKYNEASDIDKIMMIENDEMSNTSILRYFLSPENYDALTKEDLLDTLAVLTAIMCDERTDILNLEDTIAAKFGEDTCNEICAASLPDEPHAKMESILKIEDAASKAKAALTYLDQLNG